MWTADKWKDFEVIDCSGGEKLERWGKYCLVRPDPQVIWDTPRRDPRWKDRDARYSRSSSGSKIPKGFAFRRYASRYSCGNGTAVRSEGS